MVKIYEQENNTSRSHNSHSFCHGACVGIAQVTEIFFLTTHTPCLGDVKIAFCPLFLRNIMGSYLRLVL